MIPYGRQVIDNEDIDAVVDVLKSDFLTQGPKVCEFESAVSDYVGSRFGVAVNSATSALHSACYALGVSKNDIVWTSPITFVASANAPRMLGAQVDFVDVDRFTGNMCVKSLKEKLSLARDQRKLPKVVIPVHMGGHTCDMVIIHELSKEFGFKIIEDASHSIGASHRSVKVGSCKYSDITVFSFHPVKIITTGEGGVATTNDDSLAMKMKLFSNHGITRDAEHFDCPSHGDWYYQQVSLGYNYRMTDIQAALGLSQLKKLDRFVEKRHELFERYHTLIGDLPIVLPKISEYDRPSLHLFVVQLHEELQKKDRAGLFSYLRSNDVGVNVHYIPVHTQPYYKNLRFCEGDFPEAEEYYRRSISLPLHASMTQRDHDFVCRKIRDYFSL